MSVVGTEVESETAMGGINLQFSYSTEIPCIGCIAAVRDSSTSTKDAFNKAGGFCHICSPACGSVSWLNDTLSPWSRDQALVLLMEDSSGLHGTVHILTGRVRKVHDQNFLYSNPGTQG
ncbi:Ankyrin-3 [Fusarium oxysporum f. sp. albedinis]|nr:Ankyrin-3 [Fusarium oxysporum f. sp. albedinis]